jgi:copper(I)-binding protein
MRTAIVLLLTLIALGSAASTVAAQGQPGIAVEHPWARASIGTSRPAAAYLTIVNNGSETARLVGFQSPVAGHAGAHRTVKKGEVMRMEPAGEVKVPPGERVVFAPGGLHVMLMDLKEPLDKGESFPLTLRFADGGTIALTVPIMGPGARGPEE